MIKHELNKEKNNYFKVSFWRGVLSTFDISGSNFKPEYKRSDTEAIRSYWENVGSYFSNAMSDLEKKL